MAVNFPSYKTGSSQIPKKSSRAKLDSRDSRKKARDKKEPELSLNMKLRYLLSHKTGLSTSTAVKIGFLNIFSNADFMNFFA